MAVELDSDSNGYIDIAKGGTNAGSAATARASLGVQDDVIVYLDDLSELQAYTGDRTTVFVEGRTAAGDGYQGLFQYLTGDYSTQCTADTTHAYFVAKSGVATSTGCWIEIEYLLNKRLNALRFGCKGDDSTSNDATLQAALTLAETLNVPLYVPKGTYQTGTPMTQTDKVVVIGAGKGLTIFKDDGTGDDFMTVTDTVEFYDCTVDGYANAFDYNDSSTVVDPIFRRVEIKNVDQGLNAQEADSVGITGLIVDECVFDTCDKWGMVLHSETMEDILVQNSLFKNIGSTATATAIEIGNNTIAGDDKNTYKIINNNFRDITTSHATAETHAILVYADYGRAIITGNTIENVSNGGTTGCEGIYTKVKYPVITGNTLYDGGKIQGAINIKGDVVGGSSAPRGYGGICANNTVVFDTFTSGTIGIGIQNQLINAHDNYIEGASLYGMYVTKPSGCKIHHNTIYGGGGADNSNPYKGIFVEVATALDNLEVDYNTIDSFAYTGTGLAVGIDVKNAVATAASGIKVRGNNIKNNTYASGTFRGIQFNASDEDMDDIQVSENEIDSATIGIIFTGANDFDRVKYYGNVYGTGVTTNLTIGAGTYSFVYPTELDGSSTWNPGNLVDGAGETKSITVSGAALGDFVIASAPYDLQDITVTAYVQAVDTVEIRAQNESGGAIDLASGTWKVRVIK